jgi:hypothetical protein
VLAVHAPRSAAACAQCGSGDPTLTVAGVEQPFAGRLRSAVELQYRSDEIGRAGIDRSQIDEARADLSVAWAPHSRWLLLAALPLLYREVEDTSLARSQTWGPGELELDAKWFVWRDRELAPRWLLAAIAGLQLPTSPWRSDGRGRYLPLEAQPGSGSWDLILGSSLASFAGSTSAYAGVKWILPVHVREPFDPGSSVRADLALQQQLAPWFALRVAAELRADRQSREGGHPDPDSGGAIAFVGGDLVWSPLEDLVAQLGVRVPALQRWHGAHREGAALRIGLVRDW